MSEPVKPGSEAAAIVDQEQQLHARVQARVAGGVGDIGPRVGAEDYDRDLIELRDAIAEAKPEDLPPLVEQMTRLAALRGRLGGSQTLPVDVRSPYFAHMVLSDSDKRRDVLVGKRGFIDRKAGVQIVDWRNAPISQIYYRYDEGDDYDDLIDGRRFSGLLEVRRNVSIASSRLRRIGAPQGTFVCDAKNVWHHATGHAAPVLQGGQGKAARAPRPVPRKNGTLGVHHGPQHRADKHLPEIAALIDREQFELITQPEAGLVVIQGGAGSGKTTVALHRIAYLNFAQKTRFSPKKILFVVPSRALARYVEAVLPSLGVQGVPVVTYNGWARNMRQRMLRGSGGKYNAESPESVSRLKKHPLILRVLSDYVADQEREVEAALAEHQNVAAAWREQYELALVPRLRAVYRWARREGAPVVEGLVTKLGRRANDILTDWAEVMTDRSRLQVLIDEGAATQSQLDRLVRWVSDQQPNDDGSDGSIEGLDGRAIDEGDPAGRFDPEDDPIILRLVQLKRGGLIADDKYPSIVRRAGAELDKSTVVYEHVAIDEAQDRSALEVKVLLEATAGKPNERSVTIAGDTAQRLVFDNAFTTWSELLEATGHAASVMRPLRLSYRSTAEVMELARDILGPELAPEEPLVARNGAPVELHSFSGIGEAIAFLSEALRTLAGREPTASCAVIARYPEQADAYYDGLTRAEVPSLRRVSREDFSFEPGIDVTDVTQVKGLEFDYAILVDVNSTTYPAEVEARHLLHIGATRAAHQLWLISTATVSPLIPDHVKALP